MVYFLLNKQPLREGVIFTPYDNSKLFNKPWDKFCIQPPPSCQKDTMNAQDAHGNPPIGCWCSDQEAPLLDNDCTDLEFDPYVEYR